MPPFLDYLLVSAAVIAACVYLFLTYRKKKCGGCMGGGAKGSERKIQIKIPKR
ncbi:MAG: hypothetical protein KC964_09670 [Candidatus Omnitrophica bacterium]|nr:hypothetical protein [Candidatus Omnitrophota bacterium]